jgi:hypothetical protein
MNKEEKQKCPEDFFRENCSITFNKSTGEEMLDGTLEAGVYAMEEYSKYKLQIANAEIERLKDKEIRGDRKLVELEHEKTVLKSQLKAKDEMLDKMTHTLERCMVHVPDVHLIQELLTKYNKNK